MNTMQKHSVDVQKIQEQMKYFFERRQKIKIYHGSTTSTRAQKFEKDRLVDISRLNHVIDVNAPQKYVLVEPNVPMDKLIEHTLRFNLIPPVVPEYPGITVGGGIQGGAGESSSFKFGGVHDCCTEYEIMLGNGNIITASPTQNKDLFYGTACSYGTLGIITLVKMRLIPAKKFVHLKYYPMKDFEEAINSINKYVGEAVDFIDAILFEKKRGTMMVGSFSDKKDLPVSTFTKASDAWFYIHTDEISQKLSFYEEIIPIRDYLFRYDRGAFWLGRYAFSLFKIPFTNITRFLLNRAFKTRVLSLVGQTTNISQEYIVQDLCLPRENILTFLKFIDEELHIYPLWIVPLRPAGSLDKLSPNYIKTDLVINVGVWGKVAGNYYQINRKLENKLTELNGRKVLYAHAYYPLNEFWNIYDHSWYVELRKKYFSSQVFPDVYEKTTVQEKYKPSIITGIIRALCSTKIPISK